MPTPDFILALRDKIGHAPLWLSGVTAVVVRDSPQGTGEELLMVRRADNGEWTPVTGIIDPGEQPADAAVREVAEEAGVEVVPVRLVLLHTSEMVTYENGDQSQYLDVVFRMAWVSGEPHPADGENTDAAWVPVGELPPLSSSMAKRVDAALADESAARFVAAGRLSP